MKLPTSFSAKIGVFKQKILFLQNNVVFLPYEGGQKFKIDQNIENSVTKVFQDAIYCIYSTQKIVFLKSAK